MPGVIVGHNVATNVMRPTWLLDVPQRYKHLVERCWAHNPEDRCVA